MCGFPVKHSGCGDVARRRNDAVDPESPLSLQNRKVTFVGGPLAGASPSASKYPASVTLWMNSSSWNALGFVIDRPHYYQYATEGTASGVTARAVGDIDGDTVLSTFERSGVMNSGEIQGTRLRVVNELE